MAVPPGAGLARVDQDSRSDHVVFRSRHCQSCTPHANHVGFQGLAGAAASFEIAAEFQTSNCHRRRRRPARAHHVLIYVATGRRQNRCRAIVAHPARALSLDRRTTAKRCSRRRQPACAGFWCSCSFSSAQFPIWTASICPPQPGPSPMPIPFRLCSSGRCLASCSSVMACFKLSEAASPIATDRAVCSPVESYGGESSLLSLPLFRPTLLELCTSL